MFWFIWCLTTDLLRKKTTPHFLAAVPPHYHIVVFTCITPPENYFSYGPLHRIIESDGGIRAHNKKKNNMYVSAEGQSALYLPIRVYSSVKNRTFSQSLMIPRNLTHWAKKNGQTRRASSTRCTLTVEEMHENTWRGHDIFNAIQSATQTSNEVQMGLDTVRTKNIDFLFFLISKA